MCCTYINLINNVNIYFYTFILFTACVNVYLLYNKVIIEMLMGNINSVVLGTELHKGTYCIALFFKLPRELNIKHRELSFLSQNSLLWS